MKRLALVALLAIGAPAQAVVISVNDPAVFDSRNIAVANGYVWSAAVQTRSAAAPHNIATFEFARGEAIEILATPRCRS